MRKKEVIKLSLFLGYIIVYVENPKKSTAELVAQNSKDTRVLGSVEGPSLSEEQN